ncbi:MAG: HAD family hydrolase [Nocardioidaceae bacterium]
MTVVVRLAMWSGPRNISTALMRSWEHRPDSVVVDEPLYPHFLSYTGIDHPGRDEVLANGETDWRVVVEGLLGPVPEGIAVFYQKHMAHHLVDDIDPGWIAELTNVLLIRDPREVVASYIRSREQVTVADIGLPQQQRLLTGLASRGTPPTVIDAADFLRQPEGYLRALCSLVDLPFTEAMLSWPAGRRESDGVWGRYWYDAVWRSTGFEPYRPRAVVLEGAPAEVARDCTPIYEHLHGLRYLL